MAEAIILALATSIFQNITSLTGGYVTEEFNGFKSVRNDLKAIADYLESITSVLHNAEARQYTNEAMKIWLRDLKSVSYDIDDLLDEVASDAKQRSLNRGQILPKLGYYLSFKPLISRIDLTHKIKDLRKELKRIVAKKTEFDLTHWPIQALKVERDVFDVCGYVNKLAIVGRDEAKNNIISGVLGLGDESSLSVLPIVGMGGIGKTALAKLVYNDIDHFDIKLWVCVSDKFDIQKILQDILKDATRENMSSVSLGDQLVERVQHVLKDKKFFLVLDDLWEDDIRLWLDLKSILGVGGTGSLILITSRIDKVASNTQTVEPYNLDELPDSVCWRIFENLAFADGEEKRYPRLCEIGMSIVKKCCGIPLVVRSLGSLLRSERDEREWLRIQNMDSLNQLDGQYETVKQVLKLSYDKLPSHLKPCFAHLSLYAKDNLYFPYYHSYCWSALGLLKLPDGNCFKHNFIDELISRSMLQDIALGFNKNVRTFKVHDLLHDVAGDLLGEELVVITRNNMGASDSSRYISWELDDMCDKNFPIEIKAKKSRAFIFRYRMRSSVSLSFLRGIISSMPRLRILGIGGSSFPDLPSTIGNLKHLRVLDMSSNTLIKVLPNTICQLLNLECLILDGCGQLEELPSDVCKLISLRFISVTTRQRSLDSSKLNTLPCLRYLRLVSCKELVSLWHEGDVGRLTSLCNLLIVNCPKLPSLPNSMKHLVNLEELVIIDCKQLDLAKGEALSGLQSLRSLIIDGIPRLSCLPDSLVSASGSLKYLNIHYCGELVKLPNWIQSFASVETLIIVNCPKLLSLPEGISHLKFLQILTISDCPHLSRRCGALDGEDFHLIQRVPQIWLDGRRVAPKQQ